MDWLRAFLFARPGQLGKNYYVIDGLRGLAALAVLVFHYLRFFVSDPQGHNAFSLYRAMPWPFELGGPSVLLFWCISGFVFLHVYGTQAKSPEGWTFFVNRFSRLYPLHFITLLAVTVIQIVSWNLTGAFTYIYIYDLYHFVLQIFFASEWGFAVDRSFNGPIWSVSIEVLIYAVFFVYMRLMPVNMVSIAAMLLISMLGFGLSGGRSEIGMCAVYFFYGCMAYALYAKLPCNRLFMALTGGALLVGIAGISALAMRGSAPSTTLWLPPLFLLALMLLAQIEHLYGSKPFKWLQPLGNITYSSYLWHTPFQMVLMLLTTLGIVSSALYLQSWFLFVFLGVTVAISLLSFRYIEKPAQRALRHRMLPRKVPPGPQVAP